MMEKCNCTRRKGVDMVVRCTKREGDNMVLKCTRRGDNIVHKRK